ncbi:MAG: helix-turn-helix transcriptional regulator [Chloroflexi bacterium]|nr:helix-turn-helix transcriptional regulator [Chloroflexota bacterium]
MNGYFGDQVRRLRTQRGLTQRDLAKLVGLSQAQISLHEKGEDLPGPAIRLRYARALGITLGELEELIRRSQVKEYLRASPDLSDEAKRSIEDYIDFAWDRDRQAREARQRQEPPKEE